MAATQLDAAQQGLYTCMSCLVGFHSPLDQRTHYRSDLHRYNMKRQVAGLPPVRQDLFEQKIQQRDAPVQGQQKQAQLPLQRHRCFECAKSFASANALATHLNSRRHKEKAAREPLLEKSSPAPAVSNRSDDQPLVFRLPSRSSSSTEHSTQPCVTADEDHNIPPGITAEDPSDKENIIVAGPSSLDQALYQVPTSLSIAANASEAEVEAAIASRLATSTRLDPSRQCIFCHSATFTSLEASIDHMQVQHGFFLPERQYLIDLPGLVQYLADKVTVGHLCLYCNGKGKGFHTADAVQKHMLHKSHCKVAYATEEEQLELSDFYDFSSSYPDYQSGTVEGSDDDGDDWEDLETGSGVIDQDQEVASDALSEYPGGVHYGDSELELVLPSGARLGHRSLARYYRQTLFSTPASIAGGGGAGGSGSTIARRLIDQGRANGRDSALMVKDRNGGEVKARSKGEAKEARRHIREFRDTHKRQQFITRIGFVHNSQKHFRDPLLQ